MIELKDKYDNVYRIETTSNDIHYHTKLIKQDTETTYSVEEINRAILQINSHRYKNNLFLYKNDELVGFIYAFSISSTSIQFRYLWYKTAKYATILLGLYIYYNPDIIYYHTGRIYKSSKWYKFYNLFTSKQTLSSSSLRYCALDTQAHIKTVLTKLGVIIDG